MKKRIILFLLTFIFAANIFAQYGNDTLVYDPEAKKILDKLSKQTQSYETIRLSFSYTIHNKAENVKDSYNGYVFLKGKKYKLILPGNEIFTDGTTVWTYNKDAEEINVTEFNPDDESVLNPNKLFTIYEKGFKYRLRAEGKEKIKIKEKRKIKEVSKTTYTIDLYPEKPQNAKYKIIRLTIDKAKSQMLRIVYMGKDGTDFIIEILEFKPNVKIIDKIFVYDKNKYPNADLIDLR